MLPSSFSRARMVRAAAVVAAAALAVSGCSDDAGAGGSGTGGSTSDAAGTSGGAESGSGSGAGTPLPSVTLKGTALPEQTMCRKLTVKALGLTGLKLEPTTALGFGEKYKDPLTKKTLTSSAWTCAYSRPQAKEGSTFADFTIAYRYDNSPLADRLAQWQQGMTDSGATCTTTPSASIGNGAARVTCATPYNVQEDVIAQFGQLGLTCTLVLGPTKDPAKIDGRAEKACIKALNTILT